MREQMVISLEQCLPAAEAELPSRVDDIPGQSTSSHDSERQLPLQRINAGISSIVRIGGWRPAGWVRVSCSWGSVASGWFFFLYAS